MDFERLFVKNLSFVYIFFEYITHIAFLRFCFAYLLCLVQVSLLSFSTVTDVNTLLFLFCHVLSSYNGSKNEKKRVLSESCFELAKTLESTLSRPPRAGVGGGGYFNNVLKKLFDPTLPTLKAIQECCHNLNLTQLKWV